MSWSNSSSSMPHKNDLMFKSNEQEYSVDVPPDMRDNYYFSLLISNLNVSTTTEVLKSVFGSLPRFLHVSVDMDTHGESLGTGEVIFTDAATMSEDTIKMAQHIIDGQKISVLEMTLYDVKPEFFQEGRLK